MQSAVSQGFNYSFNGCSLSDQNGNFSDIESVNDTVCQCGVLDESLFLNGQNDTFFMPTSIKGSFSQDFTFGFYFQAEYFGANQPIIAIQDSCDRDSSLVFRYLPMNNRVELSVSERVGKTWTPTGDLALDNCWHSVVLTKEGNIYTYYLDNQFIEQFDFLNVSPLGSDVLAYIGSSPCVLQMDELFRGRIDEIFLENRVWSFTEVRQMDLAPDKIITADTTIFAGNSVKILTGNSCANNFNWNPTIDLADANTNCPTATPSETTKYFYETNQASCSTLDSITINVVSEDDLSCEDLLVPNVFTPNGDNVNDIFQISNQFLVEEVNSFEIFDRMGGKVFFTSNKTEGWNGEYNGQAALLGLYMYRIEYQCNGEMFAKQGSFSLMR